MLGTITSNAHGLIAPPSQPNWFYSIQYQSVIETVLNNAQGQATLSIPPDTTYHIIRTGSHQVVSSGNSGTAGDVTLPWDPHSFLTVVYKTASVTTTIPIYETTR